MRRLTPLIGAAVAALRFSTIARAQADGDNDGTNRAYAFAGGTTGPGCGVRLPPADQRDVTAADRG